VIRSGLAERQTQKGFEGQPVGLPC
jgi:hypothetical protein